MVPKRGGGKSKGKQPAKKAPAKRSAIELLELEIESDREDQRVILEQLAALEKVQGLSPRGPMDIGTGIGRGMLPTRLLRGNFKLKFILVFYVWLNLKVLVLENPLRRCS